MPDTVTCDIPCRCGYQVQPSYCLSLTDSNIRKDTTADQMECLSEWHVRVFGSRRNKGCSFQDIHTVGSFPPESNKLQENKPDMRKVTAGCRLMLTLDSTYSNYSHLTHDQVCLYCLRWACSHLWLGYYCTLPNIRAAVACGDRGCCQCIYIKFFAKTLVCSIPGIFSKCLSKNWSWRRRSAKDAAVVGYTFTHQKPEYEKYGRY